MTDDLSFDAELRRALAPGAAQAALPPDTLRVPAGWVRQRRSTTGLLGRALAYGLVAVAAMVVAVEASGWLPRTTQVRTVASVAGMVAVPQPQVLATRDGFLAVRFSPSVPETVELLLIAPNADPSVLATGSLTPDARVPDNLSMVTFPLSCVPAAGLEQPDIVFGYVQLASAPVDQITLSVPATGTSNDGLFVFALDGDAAPSSAVVRAQSTAHPEFAGTSQVAASRLSHGDACQGGPVAPAD